MFFYLTMDPIMDWLPNQQNFWIIWILNQTAFCQCLILPVVNLHKRNKWIFYHLLIQWTIMFSDQFHYMNYFIYESTKLWIEKWWWSFESSDSEFRLLRQLTLENYIATWLTIINSDWSKPHHIAGHDHDLEPKRIQCTLQLTSFLRLYL